MISSNRSNRTGLVALFVIFTSACGTTGPDNDSVAGTWSGLSQLPAARTTSMSLTQNGNTVGGTMTIAGSFIDQPFVGLYDPPARTMTWTVFDGCEEWSGTLTLSSDGQQLSGPVVQDVSGCSSGSDSSGTMSVTRQ